MIDIQNKDCLEHMKTMESDSIDMIFTSPPYVDRRKDTYGGYKADKYNDWFIPLVKEMKRIIKPTGSIFINIKSHCDDGVRNLYVMKLVIRIVEELKLKFIDELCWTKSGFPGRYYGRFKNAFEPIYHFSKGTAKEIKFNPLACGTLVNQVMVERAKRKFVGMPKNGSGMTQMKRGNALKLKKCRPSNVIHCINVTNQTSKNKFHPAVFPVKLVDFFVKSFTDKYDVVYDPFSGSATTGVSCKQLDRNYIGSELNKYYYEQSLKIIEDMDKNKGRILEW